MKMSLSWLRRYVDITIPVDDLREKMIMSGFEVESIEKQGENMTHVVAARILHLEKHPDSDHLQICQMDVGTGEPVQIITGAQNVFEGALVPAALHDAHLPNGMHIKNGKLRGLPSNGMLCSGEELGLTEKDYPGASVNGIMILKDDCPTGTDMREVLHLTDVIIDFKITANRPDCQCVLGVAREIAVALKETYRGPEPAFKTTGGDIHDHMAVSVKDYDLCPRYYGRVVTNMRIKESPDWMKNCLTAAGMRPINNIVDITNFVMLETGQPMHAFNLDKIAGHQIVVRRAAAGETITTLDGKAYDLTNDMLVIADAERPSCLAGIMGGLESEITEDTHNLFLESAKFRRDNIRRTSRTLGVRTEASGRFERGMDIMNTEYAMNRALQLIDELDAGDIMDGTIDCHNGLPAPRTLHVTSTSINALLGVDVPEATIVDILNRLNVETTVDSEHMLTCRVPSLRDDLEGRADLAEEVMRVYGYDHIISTPMRGSIVRGKKLPDRRHTDTIKALLNALGMDEIKTYSFISGKAIDTLRLSDNDERRQVIRLLNPLGEEYSTLRTQLTTSMLTVLGTNYSRKNPTVRFFETSKIFHADTLPITDKQPDEIPVLSLGLYGDGEDFFSMKGIVEALLNAAGLRRAEFARSDEPFLHPGRQAAVTMGGTVIATFGEVHPDVAEAYGIGVRAYTAEIRMAPLFDAMEEKRVLYKPLPRFPAVERDLALLCGEEVPVGTMQKTIRKAGGNLLESIVLFDVYQGEQIESGKKSVAFSLMFRSPDGTLTDKDIDPLLEKIYKKLKEIGCILRV